MNTLQIFIIVAIFLLFVEFGIIVYAFNSFPSEKERDDVDDDLQND